MGDAIKVIYTGAFRFPNQDAAATRVLLNAKCLRQLGCDVEFLSWSDSSSQQKEGRWEGFSYVLTGDLRLHRTNNALNRVFNFLFLGRRALLWLFANRQKLRIVDVIILYNPPSIFALFMLFIAKLYRIKLVLDSTEWYEAEHLPGGRFGLVAIENVFRMRCVYPLFGNIIAISTFLEKYYKRSSCSKNVIRIPALSDPAVDPFVRKSGPAGSFCILYAGNAGNKDNLLPFLRCLPRLNSLPGREFYLHLYGPERSEVERILTTSNRLSILKYVVFHGKTSRQEVLQAYANAHFSILFRDSKRYALAGFPTKAVESWSSGVPLITNASGDLKLYCTLDNAILVDIDNLESQLCSFFAYHDSSLHDKMARASIQTAEKYFCWPAKVDEFSEFMCKLRREAT